jgi:hypothetical protein
MQFTFTSFSAKIKRALSFHIAIYYLVFDVGDAAGDPLFLVVRSAGRAQNQAVALNARLPLAPAQLDGGAMGHSLRRGVL